MAAALQTFVLVLAILFVFPQSARAADPPADPAGAQLDRLIDAIEQPEKRGQLLQDLRTLRAALDKAAGQPQQAAPEEIEEPIGTYLLSRVIDRVQAIVAKVTTAARALGDPGRLTEWLTVMTTDPVRRGQLVAAIGQLLVLVAVGCAVALVLQWLTARASRRVEAHQPEGQIGRISAAVLRLAIGLIPLAGLVFSIGLAQAWLEPAARTKVLVSDTVNALALVGAANLLLRAILAPFLPHLRPVPLTDEVAAYLYIWLRRFVLLGFGGFFLLEGFRHLGMPDAALELLLNLYGLALVGLAAVLIQQNRTPVSVAIRGRSRGTKRRLGSLRERFADVWHMFALFYIAVVYLIWALEVEGGFELMARGTLGSAAVLVIAWGVVRLALSGLRRILAVNEKLLARNPFLERRTNLYLPVLESGVVWTVRVIALLMILTAWRIDVVQVLGSDFAKLVWSRLVGILFVLLLAFLVWEAVSGFVGSYLSRRDTDGNLIVRGGRARTLLPLLNNALKVVLGAMTTLMILSQLGVDIAPLLAGAGVVGLAVGFGSQKLVQDVITGAFLLFEDAVNVGDVITVNGTTGTVETLTIRAVALRDIEGTLHTFPFGSIGHVSNQTKTFSYAVHQFTVREAADIDIATKAIDRAFADLKDDQAVGADILRDIDIQGIEKLDAAGLTIRTRIRTRAGRQWGVRRAFNRLVAQRLSEAGIKLV